VWLHAAQRRAGQGGGGDGMSRVVIRGAVLVCGAEADFPR
jgi:hypothetical protein